MLELSLHVLDIIQNAIAAGADEIALDIEEDREQDRLMIRIRDNGRGISKDNLAKVSSPFFTTRTTRRVGLGISLLQQAAVQSDGYVEIESEEGKGTQVTACFIHSHIDRMPLGDIGKTMSVLIVGNPEIDFTYHHVVGGDEFRFDTHELTKHLDGVPLNDHNVVSFILQEFDTWMIRRNRKIKGDTNES